MTRRLPYPVEFETGEAVVYRKTECMFIVEHLGGTGTTYVIVGAEKGLVIDANRGIADLGGVLAKITEKKCDLGITRPGIEDLSIFDKVYASAAEVSMSPSLEDRATKVRMGDVLSLGDLDIKIIETHGHSPGSIGFMDTKNKMIFVGDAIGSGVCHMHTTVYPLESLLGVVRCLKDLNGQWDEIWPGRLQESGGPLGEPYVDSMLALAEGICHLKGDIEITDDEVMREEQHLQFTPRIATLSNVKIIYNPRKLHFV